MNVAGLILFVIGGVIIFAGAMGLKFHRASREDDGGTPLDAIEFLVSGGLLATLSEVFRLLGAAFKDRSSPLVPLAILLATGLVMLVGGVALFLLGGR